jgi:hypothetical protein
MTSKYELTASLVLYNTPLEVVRRAVDSFLATDLNIFLLLLDNSPTDTLRQHLSHQKIRYIFNNRNLGYGRAHNIALREAAQISRYHIVLNPDVEFQNDVIEQCITYMDQHPNIGLLMPKILYPDGSIQYLCKMLPTPFDLIMRRFIPDFLKPMFQARLDSYELKHKNYNEIMEVPNLSGCFMLIRCAALKTVGLFDERFFMYLEDTDLSRRINSQYQTVYYPEVSIIHNYEKGSYKNYRLLKYHIRSAFYYFTKWGWLFDATRNTINSIIGRP